MPSDSPIKTGKFYIRAPDLEFRINGPIKIGNILTDLSLPQDPISFLDPLPKIISGSGYGEGRTESEHHSSVHAGLPAKLYDVFGGQAEAKRSSSVKTIYEFKEVEALYLEKNPTVKELKALRERDAEVKSALRNKPVYIVTGLKIVKGLKYTNERASERSAELSGGAHVTKDVTLGANANGEQGGETTDSWTVLGDCILAYRLHIVKKEGWSWRGEVDLNAKSYLPGDAGFMNQKDEVDDFKVATEEVQPKDIAFFAKEQEFSGLKYVDFADEEEEWVLAMLEE